MKLQDGEIVLSPSDLMRFRGCIHATALDLRRLKGEDLTPAEDTADMALLQGKGDQHERGFLDSLRAKNARIIEIETAGRSPQEALKDTINALKTGADYIYQAALSNSRWAGYSDFLERVEQPSNLGAFSYEIIDTKLKRTPSPQHVLQLAIYAELLGELQGRRPDRIHIVLGDKRRVSLRLADYAAYAGHLKDRLEQFVAEPWQTYSDPVAACGLCRWREFCSEQWEAEDNICLVAGISKTQRTRLRAVSVDTVAKLAALNTPVPKLAPETQEKLSTQAKLQNARRAGGSPAFQLKPVEIGRGLSRLPKPDPGDLFFDMEGDPYYDQGLEYLFGIYADAPEVGGFKAFWAHDRDAERKATADVLQFFSNHLKKYSNAHIYHYAAYEVTALKKLASWHGVGEAALDQLLRENRFVDLYRVVHQGIYASEPGYSIKDLETFYLPARTGAVKSGMDSVVSYEAWRDNQDAGVLEEIRAYNETDCRSTKELRDWLVTSVRPAHLDWWHAGLAEEKLAEQDAKTIKFEAERAALRAQMEAVANTLGRDLAELLFELCWFYQREDKPQWWAMFDRADRDSEDLLEDLESMAKLEAVSEATPVKKSFVRRYQYPIQETKLRPGSNVKRKDTLGSVTLVELDLAGQFVDVKFGPSAGEPPDKLDLIPGGPIDNQVLRAAVSRVVESIFAGETRYSALLDFLKRSKPRLSPASKTSILLNDGEYVVSGAARVIKALNSSCLAIQGPPGTGKTYTSSHVILELLKDGKRVAVTSNSHKAIDNLLKAVADRARETGYPLYAVKKISSVQKGASSLDPLILEADSNDDPSLQDCPLVGGTAWLFARPEHDQQFDYIFVDEAGQVSLANILATGCAAKNVVLVGDPMQLGQPIQGAHPGFTGNSSLEYLLSGFATVPEDRGIFLPVSRRMHPSVCRYISEVVYEGRLESDAGAASQALLPEDSTLSSMFSGIHFVEVAHDGNSQSSEEEATAVCATWHHLIGTSFRDRDGATRSINSNDILVVSPYNAQVNLITSKLPQDARVGTVDRFQGQEAPICLISMATSSSDEMPRNIEFLFSVNRLNVAISRAQVLAKVFASPRLLDVSCTTVDQMRLVNALCAVRSYSAG